MDPNSLALKSKLPIKRKTPEAPPPPPFKFHRIWTEHDEIRFLEGLLSPASLSLSFPRDLNTFYSRFSLSMPQPYTKSQLSEKLRRLRKKFRVISARLLKGLDPALLSPHDRELYALSRQLWHPDFAHTSPFSAADKLVGVKVEFAPHLEMLINCDHDDPAAAPGAKNNENNEELFRIEDGGEGKLSEVDVKFEDCIDDHGAENIVEHLENGSDCNGNGFAAVEEEEGDCGAAKIVMNVFDEAVEEVRKGIANSERDEERRFEKRWQEQCGAELDVFAQRMRLILESSIPKV